MLQRFAVFLCLIGVCLCQQASRSGIDRASFDTSCKPCEDFWRYANGGWMDKNPIPARFPSWGPASVLAEKTRADLREILETAAKDTAADAGSNRRKVGDLYSTCLDTQAIDALGTKPLQPYLDRVAAVSSVKELAAALIAAQEVAAIGPYGLFPLGDLKNAEEVILYIDSSGLSLPDRDMYFKDDARSKMIRDEFLKHVARMMELLGDKPETTAAEAQTVMAFESKLAEATRTVVQRRDIPAMYHKADFAGLSAMTPDFDWKPLFSALHLSTSLPINVTTPEFMARFNQQLTAAPLADWKTWMRWRLLSATAGRLAKPLYDENFHFRSTILNGVTEQQPRWHTCTGVVDNSLGEVLGQLYVAKYFPPDAKKRATDLVENLRAALGEQVQGSTWLADETKKNAAAKLAAFLPKLGYPDQWRDYSGLPIDRKSYFENMRASNNFERRRQFAKIGKPVDRMEWQMTPPTLNAYYNPLLNEVVFPAGILQPPFFDPAADDAVNYGAVGAVIGHEMGHGFDDQGSKFDARGNMKDWWTAADQKSFTERTACTIEQYDSIDIGGGVHHKGKLVVGEAMGDLNGLKLAYRAYQRSLRGKPAPPVIDGFTGDQRFFLAFARLWGSQLRPEALNMLINTDPHPVPKFRCNATLQNMPEFHKAFQCKAGDPMVRPADKQCSLW
jgi:endothelin-converting enzyme/putative endopeptidase